MFCFGFVCIFDLFSLFPLPYTVCLGVFVLTQIRLELGCLGVGRWFVLTPPPPASHSWYILLYNFLVTHSNFMIVNFSKINLGLIFCIFLLKLKLVFKVSALFRDQVLFFCMSFVGKMNISLTILVLLESRRFRKNFYWLF